MHFFVFLVLSVYTFYRGAKDFYLDEPLWGIPLTMGAAALWLCSQDLVMIWQRVKKAFYDGKNNQ
jgi:hypothetical protein